MSAGIDAVAAKDRSAAAAALLWRTVLTGTPGVASLDAATADTVRVLAGRLAARCSAGWTASLLAPLTPLLGAPAVDPAAATASVLLSRLTLAAHISALRRLTEAGLHPVVLKGLANAHRLHDPPTPRVLGDIDVLLPRAEIGPAIDLFLPLGFRFGGVRRTRWGFVSDASYVPFHSPDGITNIDLHVEADAWPLPRGLPADDVRAGVQALALPDGVVHMPRDEHVLLICVSNIAKDRFGWQTAAKVIDAARLLLRHGAGLDWREIDARAARARLSRPLDALLALLVALDFPSSAMPRPARPPRGLAAVTWRRIVDDWRTVFAGDLSGRALLWRDLTLMQSPATFARFNWWRVKGLVRPADGIPPEAKGRAIP
ncbi:MAG TPA: nucleotidyltransferase family protein [Vineibacter sp.]|nr:nucleotidyltransferase family protein [Vineibacter sp.]